MNLRTARVVRAPGASSDELAEPVSGVLVYEDFVTGVRARNVFEQCAAHLGTEIRTRVSLWRFDVLELAAVRDHAVREAAGADLVVLSAHGDAGVSSGLRSWLAEWLGTGPGQPWALIVSLDGRAGSQASTGRLLDFLGPLALRANVDLFSYSAQASSVRSERVTMRAGPWSVWASESSGEAPEEHDPSPRWGINE